MTTQELNRDVKRLWKATIAVSKNNDPLADIEYTERIMRAELVRLYEADDKFESLSRDSIIKLIRLNLKWRAIPLHQFGSRIELCL